jgi:hypothetical protein
MAQTGHELEIFRFKQKVTRNQEFTPFPPEKNLLKKFSFQVCISKWAAAVGFLWSREIFNPAPCPWFSCRWRQRRTAAAG